MTRLVSCVASAGTLCVASIAAAHDAGFSELRLEIEDGRLRALLILAVADVAVESRAEGVDVDDGRAFVDRDAELRGVVLGALNLSVDGVAVVPSWSEALAQPRPSPFALCGLRMEADLGRRLEPGEHALRVDSALIGHDREHFTWVTATGPYDGLPTMKRLDRQPGFVELRFTVPRPSDPASHAATGTAVVESAAPVHGGRDMTSMRRVAGAVVALGIIGFVGSWIRRRVGRR